MVDFYRSRKKNKNKTPPTNNTGNTSQSNKRAKTYENKSLSGPLYDKDRSYEQNKSVLHSQDISKVKDILSGKAREYTTSVAIPSSIIESAPTLEMKTILAGQLSRALVINSVDEIIIYEDKVQSTQAKINSNLFLARVFQYMETPQYLRKALVPISPDLKFAGLLPPLDVPHHPGMEETTLYREGVTLDKSNNNHETDSTVVDVGLFRRARIDRAIQPGVRVTVEFNEPVSASETRKGQKPLPAKVVSPKTPREKGGLYWGYNIRLASSFSRVMTECPFKDGYDFSIGVSDRNGKDMYGENALSAVKPFQHLLVAFGGPLGGLEEAIEADEDLKVGGDEAAELFDLMIDPNGKSGTRSLRLEESMMMVLPALRPVIASKGK